MSPDSEAVVSSEDERPWPAATTFGSLPRKETAVPVLPGGIWSSQRRGSMKMAETAQRNAAYEAVRLAPPTATHASMRPGSTPSPAASDGANSFVISQHSATKIGRSLSHSQGQRELLKTSSVEHALPLGLLAEEGDTETESDREDVTQMQSRARPSFNALHRTTTLPVKYESHQVRNNDPFAAVQVDRQRYGQGLSHNKQLEVAFAGLGIGRHDMKQRSQWQSHLGWGDLPHRNESRRHSLAEIPTRRGSPDESSPHAQVGPWPSQSRAARDASIHHSQSQNLAQFVRNEPSTDDMQQMYAYGDANNLRRASEAMSGLARRLEGHVSEDVYNIPSLYKVPFVAIDESEHDPADLLHQQRQAQHQQQQQQMLRPQLNLGTFRPRKVLYVVSFKCSRVDVFYLLENTGLVVRAGDIVIVEADRGQDLGTVQHANVSPDQARIYKRKYSEEQYKWLMMFSRNNAQGNVNPNPADGFSHGALPGGHANQMQNTFPNVQGLPRDNSNNLKPKAIKRLASPHEIKMLSEKEHNEAKAKRTCQQKVSHLHLQMEILDAEWQWDFQKLIFYYYADHYINFKDLITDLYRIYKTRIWLSAVNPASFSQHAMGQPPSGIGPGAITSYDDATNLNDSYATPYGADPDPYGAIPPYRIGYETYTPNYPAIPGMPNSFAPASPTSTLTANANNMNAMFSSMQVDPDMMSSARMNDYQSWQNRNQQFSSNQHYPLASSVNVNYVTSHPQQFLVESSPQTQDSPHTTMQSPQQGSLQSWSWQSTRSNPAETGGAARVHDSQAPIGTRPTASRQSSQAFAFGRPSSAMRANSIASPSLHSLHGIRPGTPGHEGHPFPDSASAISQTSTSMSAGSRGGLVNKQNQVKSYLSTLPDPTTGYADEMSRER